MRTALTFMMALLVAGAFSACKKTEGCTDPNSVTFNPDANKDDGSCVSAQEYQGVFLVNFTQTWCGPCGSWGKDAFENIINAHKDRIRPISSHGSTSSPDGFLSDAAAKMNQAFKPSGYPSIYVNQKKVGSNLNSANQEVNAMLAAGVTASTAGVAKIEGSQVTVDLQVKFFKEATGSYYVNVYVLENNLNDVQNGYPGGMYNHMHILRLALADGGAMGIFGKQVANGSAGKGKVENVTMTGTLQSTWKKDDLEFMVIVWKANSMADFEFVNASYAKVRE